MLRLRSDLNRSGLGERQAGARYALLVFSFINLLNYADRYVPSSVKTLIKDDLGLTDTETALPVMGMTVVYSVCAVFFGWLNDLELVDRRMILAIAILFWSVATSLAGLADNVASLVLLRSMVGVGEAAYVTTVPTMLSDFYPAWERPVVFGIYYLALPVGAAVGFGVGAMVGATYGWRVAFYLCGLPGIFASLSVLRVVDPERGINEPERVNDSEEEIISPLQMNSDDNDYAAGVSNEDSIPITHTLLSEFWEILTNKVFMCATLGLAANAFALGGLADWYATYLLRYCNVSLQSAGLVAGAATIVGGLLGNVMGCKIADHLDGRVKSSYLLVPALFCIPAALCNIWAVNSTNSTSAYLAIFLTQTFAWTQIGPLSTVSITSVKYRLRARSSGIQIIIQHFLGDVISPPIIGGISDSTGSLMTGLQTTWLALLVSGLCWGAGSILLLPISYARHDAEYKRTVTIREILSDAPTFTLKEADK